MQVGRGPKQVHGAASRVCKALLVRTRKGRPAAPNPLAPYFKWMLADREVVHRGAFVALLLFDASAAPEAQSDRFIFVG